MSILYRNLVLIQFLFRSPGTVPAPPPLPSQQFGHNAQQPTLQQVIERQQQRQQQQQQQQQQQNTPLQNTFEASVQLLTENIATDITRLQSLQVVSNMLHADFRLELENMVQVKNKWFLFFRFPM